MAGDLECSPLANRGHWRWGRAVRQPHHYQHSRRARQPSPSETPRAFGQCQTWPVRPLREGTVCLSWRRMAGPDHRRQASLLHHHPQARTCRNLPHRHMGQRARGTRRRRDTARRSTCNWASR